MKTNKDQLYTQHSAAIGSFKFDGPVVDVFDDMIRRSVPGYLQIISLLPTLTRYFAREGGNYYDLGCSTGAGLIAMADGLGDKPATLIGLDNSAAMIEQVRLLTSDIELPENLKLSIRLADITDSSISDAAMVLMNFTLQFIPVEQRDDLLASIFSGLVKGGVLVLSEKLKSSDPTIDQLLTSVHHQFKADQGYSDLEISKKRDAIETVLVPETLKKHKQRLQKAGFCTVTPWIRNLQFVSILAVK